MISWEKTTTWGHMEESYGYQYNWIEYLEREETYWFWKFNIWNTTDKTSDHGFSNFMENLEQQTKTLLKSVVMKWLSWKLIRIKYLWNSDLYVIVGEFNFWNRNISEYFCG